MIKAFWNLMIHNGSRKISAHIGRRSMASRKLPSMKPVTRVSRRLSEL